MNEEFKEYLADDKDALRLNVVRSDLVVWIVERFQLMLAEERHNDALAFMDEWFEWVDKDSYINESTLFFDEEELNELYKQIKS